MLIVQSIPSTLSIHFQNNLFLIFLNSCVTYFKTKICNNIKSNILLLSAENNQKQKFCFFFCCVTVLVLFHFPPLGLHLNIYTVKRRYSLTLNFHENSDGARDNTDGKKTPSMISER